MNLQLLQFLNRMKPTMQGSYNPSGVQIPAQPQMQMPMQTPVQNPYEPSNQFGGMLNDQITNMPVRQEPSKMRKLGAFIAALGSENPIDTSRQYQDFHYNNQMNDWKQKTDIINKGTIDERVDNTNKRLFRNQEETERKNREAEKDRDIKQRDTEARTDIQRKRAETYATVANGGTLKMEADGSTFLIYRDGTKREIDVDQFSPKELEDLRSKHRLEQITASGNVQSGLVAQRGGIQKDLNDARIASRISGVNMGSLGGKPLSELEKSRLANNNSREFITRNPDWADYIRTDDKGNFIKIEPKGVSGKMQQLTASQVQDVGDQIFGRKPVFGTTEDSTKYDARVEKIIADTLALKNEKYKTRDDVVAALRARGEIK